MNKILLIDKPAGWTSFDVVAKIRNAVNAAEKIKSLPRTKHGARVGHAGTLDPFATGLLIVLVGNETKKQDQYMKQDKEYEATLKLGFTSTTGDPEGEIIPFSPLSSLVANPGISSEPSEGDSCLHRNDQPNQIDVEKVLEKFHGEITQTPPIYSAIKVDGKRAYELAREGKTPEMKSRKVVIYSLELLFYYPEKNEVQIRVKCSSGTYIRTLAEDIGKALGTGAYLTTLRRTKIGEFDVRDAMTVEEATSLLPSENHQSPRAKISEC